MVFFTRVVALELIDFGCVQKFIRNSHTMHFGLLQPSSGDTNKISWIVQPYPTAATHIWHPSYCMGVLRGWG